MSSTFSFFASVVLLGASTAMAQGFVVHSSDYPTADTEPPEVVHEPVTYTPRGSELVLKAVITDPSGVFAPIISYREAGSGDRWALIDMTAVKGEADTFSASIAGSAIRGDIEYFLEVYDNKGNGPSRVGSAEVPLRVVATEPVVAQASGFDESVSKPFPVAPAAVAGAGVVLTVVGAALWFTAGSKIAEIDGKYTTHNEGRLPEDADAVRAASGRSLAGSVMMIAGGAAVVGGVAWFFVPSSDGAEVGVSGSF